MTRNRRTITGALCAASLAVLSLASAGATPARATEWTWRLMPYAWATDVGVNVEIHEREVVDETIAVSDLLEDLETIFQLRFEAMHGEHGVIADLFDVTLADEVSGIALPQSAGEADLKSDIGMTIFDLAGVYDAHGDGQGIALLYGIRVLNERATMDATFQQTSGSSVRKEYETHDTMVDGLLGVRLTQRFARRWSYQMQAEVTTGATDYTWSLGPSLGYAFGATGRYALSAGYRVMTIDYENEGGVDARMTMSGLLIGLRTSF